MKRRGSRTLLRVSLPFPEPTGSPEPRSEVLLGYLDYFRSVVLSKVDGLSNEQLRTSPLPTGWTILELVKHLTHVERRWLVWGFEGQQVAQPWGDSQGERWHVLDTEGSTDLLRALRAQGSVTTKIVRAHDLSEVGQPGERWDGADPPTLERALFHLLQEYARHVGHLDIVRELIDGQVGE